jgi:hypothetical protein
VGRPNAYTHTLTAVGTSDAAPVEVLDTTAGFTYVRPRLDRPAAPAPLPGVTARLGAPVPAFADDPAAPWKTAQRCARAVIEPWSLWDASKHVAGAPQCITPGCVRDAQWDSEGAVWDRQGNARGGSYFSACERCGLAAPGYRGHAHVHRFTPAQAAANGGELSWPTSASMGLVVERDVIVGYRCVKSLPYPAPEGTPCGHVEPVDTPEAELFTAGPVLGSVWGCEVVVSPTPGAVESWDVHTPDGVLWGRAVRTGVKDRPGFHPARVECWEARLTGGRTYEGRRGMHALVNLVKPVPVDAAALVG